MNALVRMPELCVAFGVLSSLVGKSEPSERNVLVISSRVTIQNSIETSSCWNSWKNTMEDKIVMASDDRVAPCKRM